MGIEIEKKFLVKKDAWERTEKGQGSLYSQGYLLTEPGKTIRVRLTDDAAYLTIKGATVGASRPEYEYTIPRKDARELLDGFCAGVISKTRYKVAHEGMVWEVDVFHGDNEGLLLAEIELPTDDAAFTLPPFVGDDVTGNVFYYNAYLSQHPYSSWEKR